MPIQYGPDDATLWPQPWVQQYCHLGAILRKPNDSDDPLLIMWWNPTRNNFKSFDGGLVDKLGELLRENFLSFQTMITSLENSFEDYKKTTPKSNQLLSSLVKAMHDVCHCLGSLITTYSEMRFGVTKFQHYYLKARSCLDYLELYKPRTDGEKSLAETVVANCVGAFTNVARSTLKSSPVSVLLPFLKGTRTGPVPEGFRMQEPRTGTAKNCKKTAKNWL